MKKENKTYDSFSDFFLHASKEEKERIIKEAARKANEEQVRVFEKARPKMEANQD